MQTRLQNLESILEDLDGRGVKYGLIDGSFRFSLKSPPMTEDLRTALDVCRSGLTYALRLRLYKCADCGTAQPTHPKDRRGQTDPNRYVYCEPCYRQRLDMLIAKHQGDKRHHAHSSEEGQTAENTDGAEMGTETRTEALDL